MTNCLYRISNQEKYLGSGQEVEHGISCYHYPKWTCYNLNMKVCLDSLLQCLVLIMTEGLDSLLQCLVLIMPDSDDHGRECLRGCFPEA